jgi:predicted heme/steroid binding protein
MSDWIPKSPLQAVVAVAALAIPVALLLWPRKRVAAEGTSSTASGQSSSSTTAAAEPKKKRFTRSELARYDGSKPELPIYVAIRGNVFDVSEARESYAKGQAYNIFAGKDATVLLATSSLKPTDRTFDSLTEAELKTLEEWENYYKVKKAYPIVGTL